MADLLSTAQRVLGWANDNEQVEVLAVHDRDTEIRIYGGEIEQFTASESQGIGVRVIADHKQGFAYAGSLDEDVLAETLAEARDNAVFGTPDEHLGLATPDGVEVPDLGLYDERVAQMGTDARSTLALPSRHEPSLVILASQVSNPPTMSTASANQHWYRPPGLRSPRATAGPMLR